MRLPGIFEGFRAIHVGPGHDDIVESSGSRTDVNIKLHFACKTYECPRAIVCTARSLQSTIGVGNEMSTS